LVFTLPLNQLKIHPNDIDPEGKLQNSQQSVGIVPKQLYPPGVEDDS
jgi:hypothetical protein